MSQYNLANRMGARPRGLNCYLNRLMNKSFVKLGNLQHSKHKSKYAYILTQAGMVQEVAMTARFIKCKLAEYETLKAEVRDGVEGVKRLSNSLACNLTQ